MWGAMMNKPLSIAEFRALGEIAKARRDLMTIMFTGTKLRFGLSKFDTAKSFMSSAKSIYASGKKLGSTGTKTAAIITAPGVKQAVEDFVRQCADIEDLEDIVAAIGSEALKEIVGEIAPFVGVVVSTVKLAQAAKAVVEDGYNLYQHSYYRDGFRPGDPAAAAQSVRTIIERDLTRHSIDAARQAAATGAKIGGLFADFGTGTSAIIGLANSLAALGLKLYALGLDIKDWRAGNKILTQPQTLSLDCFNKCPVLGCYLITCSDTSSVANFFVADIGLPGWMDKVEAMKKKQMEPLIQIAKKEIKRSPIQLEGLRSDKGAHAEPDFFARIKSKVASRIMG